MNDWEFIAPMVMGLTLILSISGVLIFRPLTKRLGDLLHTMHRDRQARLGEADVVRLAELVEGLNDRIERLEERQDFSERLVASLDRRETHEPVALKRPTQD